ncbi:MAG: cytochrome c biogenesis protein CcdA [Chloroflexi bacterium]|nr:cytochrome c biogenesis protein CcdA [Chloroflexota bacterium]
MIGTTSQRVQKALLGILLLILSSTLSLHGRADGVVHLFYFYDPDCPVCQEIHQDVLEPLLAAYEGRVIADERSMADAANFEFLLELEKQFGVTNPGIPEIFIGKDALIGPEEIHAKLKERIDYYLAQGGVALPAEPPAVLPTPTPECTECAEIHEAQRTAVANIPTPTPQWTATPVPAEKPPIYAAWFYQPGCDLCERKEHDLQYILDKYPQVKVRRFNIKEEIALNQYLCLKAHVPEERHLIAPAIFVGSSALVGAEITGSSIEELIRPYLETGAPEPWAGWEAQKEAAEKTILERFRSLGLWTVIGAGLLDGLNPCAFATMIFLVSYLSVRKRQGREILATGAAFTVGVFFAYLGVGLGMLKFLTSLPVLNTVGKWIYAVTLVLCLGLAWGSFSDYRKAKQGQLEDMSLKLPDRMRGWIRFLIREGSRARNYIAASLVLGFVVSIVELACTGQVYLPTIIFVLGLPEWRAKAIAALFVYNLMFITPLIIVFLLVYFGTTSQQLTRWMTRRAAAVKLGTAVLFLLLAGWLGYSIITL